MRTVYPLGHDGINESENIHCLNPNHHANFDYVRVIVDPESYRVSHAYEEAVDGTELDIADPHEISEDHLTYHNRAIAGE